MNENKDLLSCGYHLASCYQSCYHKLVSHMYNLALELLSKWWERFIKWWEQDNKWWERDSKWWEQFSKWWGQVSKWWE